MSFIVVHGQSGMGVLMRGILVFIIAVASMLVPTIANAKKPPTITKSEARSLPPLRVKSRVMSQLSDLLTEDRWIRPRPPVNALTDMYFTAKPRPGLVPGLCQVDKLTINFRPVRSGRADADTPVVAEGFSARHYFHFKKRPESHFYGLVSDEYEPDASACDDVSFGEDAFINAPNEQVATDGYFLAERVMTLILGGTANFPLDCDKSPNEKDRPCSDFVREMKTSGVDLIVECDSGEDRFDPCYLVYAGDRFMRMVASPIASGPNVLPPLTPLKVKIGEMIVLSHERID